MPEPIIPRKQGIFLYSDDITHYKVHYEAHMC